MGQKIILISDEAYLGGAKLTNESLINEGINRDYDVSIYTFGKKELEGKRKFSPGKADLYIIANYGYIPREDLLKFISNNKYIRYFHDIPGFIAQIPSSFHSTAEGVLSQLINNAEHIFMISPMQFGVVDNRIKLPEDKITVTPPFIPLGKFTNTGKSRLEDSWFCLGDVNPARGLEKSIETAIENHGKYFIIAGPEVTPGYIEALKKRYDKYIEIRYIGVVPYETVPELMNTYESFVYTPEIYDSFCRKVIEAQKCGMKVYVDNQRIGLFSYPKEYDMLNGILSGNTIVWDKIDTILNK